MNTDSSSHPSYPVRGIDFAALYREFGDDIRKSLSRYSRCRVPVEDGLNEVFRIALEEYRPELPAKAWFLKTAFNVAYNWRHRVQFVYELPGVPADNAEDDISPEDWFILKETKIRIHRVIDRLDPELRQVFVLAKIEEIPLDEIAAALELKGSTVRSRLKRAMEAFMKEGRRRHAAGLLGVAPVLVGAGEKRLRAAVNRWLGYAVSAAVGGALVAAWFLSRQPPAQIPIHAEPPTLSDTRWTFEPPPVTQPPHDAVLDLPPVSFVPEPSPPDPDETARDELKLYHRGLNTYNQGRYREALEYLEMHKRRYPHGTTAPLRDNLIQRMNALPAG